MSFRIHIAPSPPPPQLPPQRGFLDNCFVQVRKDYEKIKRETNFSLIETSREDVLAQKRKDPDTNEAFQYYAATFDYTEKLRNVLIGLRKRLV